MTWLMLAAAITVLGAAPRAERDDQREWNFNTRMRDGQPITGCDQIDVSVRRGELARGEDVASVPVTAEGLSVTGVVNGGLFVRGSSSRDYAVKLCKFAAGNTAGEARATLDGVRLSVNGGVVGVEGPSDRDDWTVHVIVLAPQDARLELQTRNGPLGVQDVSGRIVARASNGPIGINGCSGEIRIDAQNGPVDISATSGDVHAVANNGPLSIRLSGQSWEGAGLEGRANNGPLSLNVPDGYQSGVQVEMSRSSPLQCRAAMCSDTVRLGGEDGGTLRIGSTDPQVRVSAHNGPVSISTSRD